MNSISACGVFGTYHTVAAVLRLVDRVLEVVLPVYSVITHGPGAVQTSKLPVRNLAVAGGYLIVESWPREGYIRV